MKKIILPIILVISMLWITALPVFADENVPAAVQLDDGSTVISYANGSKLTISPAKPIQSEVSVLATAKTITAERVVSFEDAAGSLQWTYTLVGTFTYDGSTSTCTKATYSTNIVGSGWSFSNGSAKASGNEAIGTGTFTKKFLFITVKTYDLDIHITCDKNGNIT